MLKKLKKNEIKSLLFFGTAQFAAPILNYLVAAGYPVRAVFSQPDKLLGKKELESSPVKKLAERLGLRVEQPADLMTALPLLKKLKPDLIIVAAYGQIIPKAVLDLPPSGFINAHGSLLPKYRGASPIQAAILDGEKETGVTLMLLDEQLDHGPLLAQASLPMAPSDTYEMLSDKLAELSVKLLDETLPLYLAGKIKPRPQKHPEATFTKLIGRADGLINWRETAPQIERRRRAFTPWPGIYTLWARQGQPVRLKITALSVSEVIASETKQSLKPGLVFVVNKKPAVACGGGTSIIIDKIQPAGKREMTGEEFLNGYRDFVGSKL